MSPTSSTVQVALAMPSQHFGMMISYYLLKLITKSRDCRQITSKSCRSTNFFKKFVSCWCYLSMHCTGCYWNVSPCFDIMPVTLPQMQHCRQIFAYLLNSYEAGWGSCPCSSNRSPFAAAQADLGTNNFQVLQKHKFLQDICFMLVLFLHALYLLLLEFAPIYLSAPSIFLKFANFWACSSFVAATGINLIFIIRNVQWFLVRVFVLCIGFACKQL